MHITHLTASTFFGGPERQMLGLAQHLASPYEVSFLSFREGDRCQEFLTRVRDEGFSAEALTHDTPHLRSAIRELTERIRTDSIDLVLCHGYKANLLGRIAARRAGIPVVAVSRGWTWENAKVRLYETLDRWNLRFMDHVVAVSDGQAAKVVRAGVPASRLSVIRNSARLEAFTTPDPADRQRLLAHFPRPESIDTVIVGAGRLSPEKGFRDLVTAAHSILADHPRAGFIVFGEGVERAAMEEQVRIQGLGERFRMPGLTRELDRYLPWADLVVLPSLTEGLPNVALEASAAGVAVVATAVGGTPEVIADGENGLLVPAQDPPVMVQAIDRLLRNPGLRTQLGQTGRQRMTDQFSFDAQAHAYAELFERLIPRPALSFVA